MAGIGIGKFIKWQESTFRSESENKSVKCLKKSPETGIPLDFPTKPPAFPDSRASYPSRARVFLVGCCVVPLSCGHFKARAFFFF